MKTENVLAIRFDLNQMWLDGLKEHICSYLPGGWEKNAVNYAWIPQTLYDQVWVVTEFDTPENKAAYEARLNPIVLSYKAPSEYFLNWISIYGWGIRDMDGFIVHKFKQHD